MYQRFWVWLVENFGFLTTKGFIVSYSVSLLATALFYRLLIEGESVNTVFVIELAFVGFISFVLALSTGLFVFGDNWPGLHFENFWDQIGWHGKGTETKDPIEIEGAAAVEKAMEIVSSSQEERLFREKKSGNK